MSVFDDMEEYVNKLCIVSLESKVVELNSFLDEINGCNYTTVSEVKFAIYKNIEIINAIIKERGVK